LIPANLLITNTCMQEPIPILSGAPGSILFDEDFSGA
jgi:hypothetical protein